MGNSIESRCLRTTLALAVVGAVVASLSGCVEELFGRPLSPGESLLSACVEKVRGRPLSGDETFAAIMFSLLSVLAFNAGPFIYLIKRAERLAKEGQQIEKVNKRLVLVLAGGNVLLIGMVFLAVPVHAVQDRDSTAGKQSAFGRADCVVANGYQTVYSDNGASYSGYFKNCRPLSGNATYTQGSEHIAGYATAVSDNTVVLRVGDRSVTVTLVTRR